MMLTSQLQIREKTKDKNMAEGKDKRYNTGDKGKDLHINNTIELAYTNLFYEVKR